MKRFLVAALLLACAGGVASAGPNQYGTIFAHDADLVYTSDTVSYCGIGQPVSSCEGADVTINGVTGGPASKVFKVYAAFCSNGSPRLKGMTFGVSYSDILITASGPCVGDLNNGGSELPGPGWPGNGTGTAIVFQNTLTTLIAECYWFAGYNYYQQGATFQLGPHPDPILGGKFADDAIPSNLDDIAGYGSIGFETAGRTACPDPNSCIPTHETGACCTDPDGDGYENVCNITTEVDCSGTWRGPQTVCDPNPCPQPPPPDMGACCTDPDGDGYEDICTVTLQADCSGTWQGPQTACDPNPCPQPPTPAKESTWGQIKANYR
jgi:hypothetical protein